MRIGIVGHGVVGAAVAAGMERLGHDVKVHDIKYNTSISLMFDREIVFICVPTPETPDGSANTGIVEDVIDKLLGLDWAHRTGFNGIVAVKSTVPPGFMASIEAKHEWTERFAFVPEFLREKSAFYDFTEGHDVCIVGTHSGAIADKIFKAHGHYPKSFVHLTPTEAELAKYFSNVFNALRVTFANGFYDVSKALGADYTKIKNALVKRPTIQDIYLDCNENFRGFAGVCLPKDTAAFASLVDKLGVKARIFKTIVEDNKLYKPTVPSGMRMTDQDGGQAVS
jgi:UDPglucose 6-dehydrogenase